MPADDPDEVGNEANGLSEPEMVSIVGSSCLIPVLESVLSCASFTDMCSRCETGSGVNMHMFTRSGWSAMKFVTRESSMCSRWPAIHVCWSDLELCPGRSKYYTDILRMAACLCHPRTAHLLYACQTPAASGALCAPQCCYIKSVSIKAPLMYLCMNLYICQALAQHKLVRVVSNAVRFGGHEQEFSKNIADSVSVYHV